VRETIAMIVTRAELLAFMRRSRFAVQASTSADGPQAAVVGVVVSDTFEIVFDTLATSRKAINLRHDPRIALVLGGAGSADDYTVQVEGLADEPTGDELAELKRRYLAQFPDGVEREQLPDITYFRVKPHWLRLSHYVQMPPRIVELDADALTQMR
jgi:general stress protein 26